MDANPGKAIWILTGCLGISFVGIVLALGLVAFLRGDDGQSSPDIGIGPERRVGPQPVDPPGVRPIGIVATVVQAVGSAPVAVGTECRFQVERRTKDDGSYWCNSQIGCGGRLLYGGATAGFYPCNYVDGAARHVVGTDPETTSADGDARMEIDTYRSVLSIADDQAGAFGAYTLVARIVAVQ